MNYFALLKCTYLVAACEEAFSEFLFHLFFIPFIPFWSVEPVVTEYTVVLEAI